MRLVTCHVENFGKLSDLTVSFTDPSGIQLFCEENGWGKSTLAAFIKVMFFGFDNAGKRSEIDNERKRYKPWQGGVYGGQITFEAGGSTYLMSRVFGAKENQDEFVLRDADTLLESDDFSERIGEELFQIDSASFSRSIYISQLGCGTAATDSIGAKIGNLTEHTDDLNHYEMAEKKITDRLNALSETRKTGLLYKQKGQIAQYEQEIKNGEALDASMEELVRLKESLRRSCAERKEEQGVLSNRLKAASEKKDLAVQHNEYRHLCETVSGKKRVWQQKRAFFPGRIPAVEEIDRCLQAADQLVGVEKEREIYQFDDEEEREWKSLERTFTSGVPGLHEIEEYHRKIGEAQAAKPTGNKLFLAAGAVLAAAGAALCFVMLAAGLICLLAGAAAAVMGFVRKKNPPYVAQVAEEVRAFLETYDMSGRGGEEADLYAYGNALRTLEGTLARYEQLGEKRRKYEAASRSYQEGAGAVRAFLSGLGMEAEPDLRLQLQTVKEALRDYLHAGEEYKKAVEAKDQFADGIENLEAVRNAGGANASELNDSGADASRENASEANAYRVNENESLTEIQNRLRLISEELEGIQRNQMAYDRQLEQLQEKRDAIAESEGQLAQLREQFLQNRKKRDILKQTGHYLEQAKAALTAKYTKPLKEGFDKYFAILTGTAADPYELDANLELAVTEQGMPRKIGLFSTGYQDMMGICLRMAFVDAMYPGEKPFLIFDDPFVNLDDRKTEGSLRFLREIAREYQIIYFTCREGRGNVNGFAE